MIVITYIFITFSKIKNVNDKTVGSPCYSAVVAVFNRGTGVGLVWIFVPSLSFLLFASLNILLLLLF